MIVIDDFINDHAILDEIERSGEFQTPKMWGWWDGWWKKQAYCHRELIVQYVWGAHCPLAAAAGFPNSIAGFEYWTLAHEANPDLPTRSTSNGRDRIRPHRDRDESHFVDTGESKHPRVGAVYYPVDHQVEGGYLKIYTRNRDDGPFELIEPRHNRLVIFDASMLHEVTPVTAGRRYSLAINVWDYPIRNPSLKRGEMRVEPV